jgi:hypothetical protein
MSGQPSPSKSAQTTPARLLGDVLEPDRLARPQVPVELRDRAGERSRVAVVPPALAVVAQHGRVVLHVVDHDQVEPPVAVVVHERGRRAPQHAVEAGGPRRVGERAVAVVEEEF